MTCKTVNRFARKHPHLNHVVPDQTKELKDLIIELERQKLNQTYWRIAFSQR